MMNRNRSLPWVLASVFALLLGCGGNDKAGPARRRGRRRPNDRCRAVWALAEGAEPRVAAARPGPRARPARAGPGPRGPPGRRAWAALGDAAARRARAARRVRPVRGEEAGPPEPPGDDGRGRRWWTRRYDRLRRDHRYGRRRRHDDARTHGVRHDDLRRGHAGLLHFWIVARDVRGQRLLHLRTRSRAPAARAAAVVRSAAPQSLPTVARRPPPAPPLPVRPSNCARERPNAPGDNRARA